MTDTPAPNDMPDEPKLPQVNDVINLLGHSWKVYGIHLGAVGVESLIELESLTHRSGWTGEWESHPRVFVPEVFVRHAMNTPADLRAPVAAGGEALNWKRQKDTVFAWAAEHGFTPVESEIVDLLSALQQPAAHAVDLSQIRKGAIQHGANCHGNSNIGYMFCDIFGGINAVAAVKVAERTFDYLAAQGIIKGVE